MKHYILLLTLFILAISCSKEKEIQEVVLKKARTISIPLEDQKYNISNTVAFDNKDSSEYLVIVYPLDQKIYLYDLKTGKLRKKISTCEQIIPNKIFYLNKDSIFVICHYANDMALINDRGELINTWRFYRDTTFIFLGSPFYVQKDTIIFHGFLLDALSRDNYYSTDPCFYKYTIEKNSSKVNLVQEIPYSPRFQSDTFWYDDGATLAVKDNKLYVGFEIDHNIYCYDGFKMQPILAKSKYFNKFLPFNKKRYYSIPYIDSIYTVMPYYDGFYYDNYNDLFFRKAKHPMPISPDGRTINTSDDKPFSFVIFDGSMKPINEVVMPTNLYNYMTFTSKEGLILGLIPDCSDSLKFDVYSINIKYKE